MQKKKPHKKTDKELWNIIAQKIESGDYVFLSHARKRLMDRNITDIDVLNILENRNDQKRKRNKSKDTYISGYNDWNYCIEGTHLDKRKIRVIISFDSELMLIITVIRIDH